MDNIKKLVCVEIRLGVRCDSCDHVNPVNGVVSKFKCKKCQETIKLSGRLRWQEILNYQNPSIDIFSKTKSQKSGKGEYGAWFPVKLNTKRTWPVCPKCDTEFNKETVLTNIEKAESLHCLTCNTKMSVKPSSPTLKKAFSFTEYIIGASIYETETNPEQALSTKSNIKPIVMACMACGGTLSIDGTKRLVECKFCQSSNYLPDDLWLSLHPAPKRDPWYIIFDASGLK